MKDTATYSERLRARSLKATSARVQLMELISDFGKAMPFSEIQKALQPIDRVTLYRTINALVEHGIIHKAIVTEGETYYAMCSHSCDSDHHHHQHVHFKCSACNEVTCVETDVRVQFSIPGHQVAQFEIQASGICPNCRA